MIGLHIMRPTSIVVAGAGSSASIRADGGVDFSTATSLSLNGVFTADYDNYMINIRYTGSVNNVEFFARLRDNGTDNSTASSYVYQLLLASSTTVQGARTTSNQARLGNTGTQQNGLAIYVYGPDLAQPTALRSISAYGLDNASMVEYAITHNQSVGYDGMTIYPSSGNFTGMVTVYGYAQ